MPDNTGPLAELDLSQIVTDPSKIKAVLTTIGSLLAFASFFATTLIGLVGKHDIAGIAALLQSAPVVTGFTLIATVSWGAWRAWVSWQKKIHENVLNATSPLGTFTPAAPPEVTAALAAVSPAPVVVPASPTRAPEPETGNIAPAEAIVPTQGSGEST